MKASSALLCILILLGAAAACCAAETGGSIDIEKMRETIDRLGLDYTVEENRVTRLTPEERSRLAGAIVPDDFDDHIMWETRGTGGLTEIDWRDIGGSSFVSGVRDQGPCGSCWAFGALAVMESARMIGLNQPGTDPDFAEQYVLTCNWAGMGCGGGNPEVALELARVGGIPPEACNPYEAGDQHACHTSCPETYDVVEKIQGWGLVTGDWADVDAINAALQYGPVTTSFQVYESFYAYAGGIYTALGSVPTDGWHCVAIVGFNDRDGYWIAKNSWGEDWGEDGYFRIAYNSGCSFGFHVLACTYAPSWTDPVHLVPEVPGAGSPVTVFYNPAGRWLDGSPACNVYHGHNGWTGITEDAMTWNAGEGAWEATFTVPADAHNIQMVFNDANSNWDNNGGPDWYFPVNHPGDGFVMDGFVDPGVPLLSDKSGPGLYGAWRDGTLYLAAISVGSTPGMDHFLVVLDDTTGATGSFWGKAGTTVPWAFFLGNENQNGWAGWFDAGQAVQEGSEFALGNTGPYLEGTLDMGALYGGTPPAEVWVAAVGYETFDGGALMLQSPGGNGNGDLEAAEFYRIEIGPPGTAGVSEAIGEWSLAVEPSPFASPVAIRLSLPASETVKMDVYGVSGRRVATLHDGPAGPGVMSVEWNGRDLRGAPCASGVYFFRVSGRTRNIVTKATLLR